MPDGTRKRRFSSNPAKRRWYAQHRQARWALHFLDGSMFQKLATKIL